MGELLTFVCNATGHRIEWDSGRNNIQFDTDSHVNDIRTEGNITGLLLRIQNVDGSNNLKNFFSVAFIEVTNTSEPGNINCSSDTQTFQVFNSIAGM